MDREQVLDVSELEAPEPLVQALAALEHLPEGSYLRLLHRMKPCHLYGYLAEQDFETDTRQGASVACEVFIWRRSEPDAREAAMAAAAALSPWRE